MSHFEAIEDPIADDERIALAKRCVAALKLPFPAVVDRIDDRVGEAYGAWPVRGFLLGKGGEVLFASKPGVGLDLDGLSRAIESASPRKR